jgi:putative SOS response-associated peptidase YedK
MCGRAVIISPIEAMAKEFKIDNPRIPVKPNYNTSPSQNMLAVIEQESRKLMSCRWGFIPSWAKDPAWSKQVIDGKYGIV